MKKILLQIGLPVFVGLVIGLLVIVIKPEVAGFKEDSFTAFFSTLSNRSTNLLGTGQVSYRHAVKKAAPAVVNIATASLDRSGTSVTPMPYRNSPDTDANRGSGVIVSPDGYLLTNNHVIQGAERIYVSMQDGREEIASVVGRDPDTDLAVLKIDLKDLPSIHLADSSKAEVGDVVLAIGNPFGLGQTVTMGIISATGRDDLRLNTYEDFIQTDAAINVGNSGGALVNAYGELIGINTLLFTRGGGNEGVGFAIPSRMAEFVMESIIKYGRVIRGWLGIESQPLSAQLAQAYDIKTNSGILISGVYQGGPADQAGLRRGDILTGINNVSTTDGNKVMNMVAQVPPGTEVTLQILRDNKPVELKARVSTRPRMVN
ncbi:S1C family serine protease [Endozoicomonas lisbonensis]|uniref:Serine protease DegS n=1 Tax=Endozoicomonas lisbonensis TaxID=3120522 RepID=A0ABV2SF36_9GAMM